MKRKSNGNKNASLRREGDYSLIYLDLVNGFQAIIKLWFNKNLKRNGGEFFATRLFLQIILLNKETRFKLINKPINFYKKG